MYIMYMYVYVIYMYVYIIYMYISTGLPLILLFKQSGEYTISVPSVISCHLVNCDCMGRNMLALKDTIESPKGGLL